MYVYDIMAQLNSNIHPKLSEFTIERLNRRKIFTVIDFIAEDHEKLKTITDLTCKDILGIKKKIKEEVRSMVKVPSELYKLEQTNVISTNISSLDKLLKGGLYPGHIYELCGVSSSGKTQLCFTIATTVSLYTTNFVRYIDTKRDFFASRVEMILNIKTQNNQKATDEAMERIRINYIQSPHELIRVLQYLSNILKEETDELRTRIIIIDSLPAIIFKFFNDSETNFLLNHVTNLCHFLANEFHLSIIIVNLITQWKVAEEKREGTSYSENEGTKQPTLGKYWLHIPNTRLLIEKLGNEYRKVSIWKSYQLKTGSMCIVRLGEAGVT